jgi:hypothetical protein
VGFRIGAGQQWSNPSVVAFAKGKDPVEAILDRARQVTTDAIDRGWEGPPFDPFKLADHLGIHVNASGDVRDAQVVVGPDGRFSVELNPSRARVRQRFSLAHEIAHTLFPDCGDAVRRRELHADVSESQWELEALCNIAAAEFLMPLGSMPQVRADGNIDKALELRNEFQVSAEAVIIRTVQMSRQPIAMFSASRIDHGERAGRYKLDYAIEALAWDGEELRAGSLLPADSPLVHCTAIGFTTKGAARFGGAAAHLEAVGVSGYHGSLFPRVVGYLVRRDADTRTDDAITYLRGHAISPSSLAPRIVAFMTNDVTANWGAGFARQVAVQYPDVQRAFRDIVAANRDALTLGSVHFIRATADQQFAAIIAQHGIGKTAQPKIRYRALEAALQQLGVRACELGASVHMPRLGSGDAGGNWDVIREMIEEYVSIFAPVYVYDLPGRVTTAQTTSSHVAPRLFADAVY